MMTIKKLPKPNIKKVVEDLKKTATNKILPAAKNVLNKLKVFPKACLTWLKQNWKFILYSFIIIVSFLSLIYLVSEKMKEMLTVKEANKREQDIRGAMQVQHQRHQEDIAKVITTYERQIVEQRRIEREFQQRIDQIERRYEEQSREIKQRRTERQRHYVENPSELSSDLQRVFGITKRSN